MRTVAAIALLAVASPAFAQTADEKINISVSRAELQIIGNGLMELPYKQAAPVMVDLQAQLIAWDKAAKDAKDAAEAKAKAEKPADAPADKPAQ